jgi:plastocyanin
MVMQRVLVAIVVALAVTALVPVVPVHAAQTWTVLAGGGTKDAAITANAFYPRTLEVGVGDTVSWKFLGFHNVAFFGGGAPVPLVVEEGKQMYINAQVMLPMGGRTYDGMGYHNSGAPPEDPAGMMKFGYSLTFTKPGTYQYQCIIHGPAMSGTIVVRDSAMGAPASAMQNGQKEMGATIKAGQAAWSAFKPTMMGKTVVIPLLGNAKDRYSVFRFTPKPLSIKRGTTVTWKNQDPFEIHTVTFLSGGKLPEFIMVQPQKQGPPKFLINPKVAAPTPQKSYAGMGYVNSGIIFSPGTPGNPPTSYSLTFTKAGTYQYTCIVHDALGMRGTIVVK